MCRLKLEMIKAKIKLDFCFIFTNRMYMEAIGYSLAQLKLSGQ